jgi:hypothetical protein
MSVVWIDVTRPHELTGRSQIKVGRFKRPCGAAVFHVCDCAPPRTIVGVGRIISDSRRLCSSLFLSLANQVIHVLRPEVAHIEHMCVYQGKVVALVC